MSRHYSSTHHQQQQQQQQQQRPSAYRDGDENENERTATTSRTSRNSSDTRNSRASLEDNYSRAMSRANRGGDFDPNRQKSYGEKQQVEKRSSGYSHNSNSSSNRNGRNNRLSNADTTATVPSRRRGSGSSSAVGVDHDRSSRRGSESTAFTRLSNTKTDGTTSRMSRASSNQNIVVKKKMSVSNKDPSEETIAIFGAYGVTGHYFLQLAMEAGYKIQALILPGMEMEDVACNDNLRLTTGSFDEVGKIREVVENASYVVCLLNDCDRSLENLPPPIGNTDNGNSDNEFNLNFMHNLVPILEESDTCRVLLYEASSMALDGKGSVPFFSKMVKKMALRKNWRDTKREQDKIVKYLANQTKYASFNYIITRPSDTMIWNKPSRKKLAASKSPPGPFPITNIDLADFTLCALRMEKVYNSCPYVVQDGI